MIPVDLAVESKPRALVVEDNAVNQKVIRLMLQKLGLNVDVVFNGREALQAVAATRYDIVLMDCQMPEMDGYEATRQIRATEIGARRIPIIAMTAHALEGDRERCLAAGMDDYIAKPMRAPLVAEIVARWLTRPPTPNEDLPPSSPRTTGPIDWRILNALVRSQPETGESVVQELIELFLTDASRRFDLLKDAVRNADTRRAEALAHSLRSSSGQVGALHFTGLCEQFEARIAANASAATTVAIDALEQAFNEACAALHKRVTSP